MSGAENEPRVLAPLKFVPAAVPAAELGAMPDLCLLPVSCLVVDPRYQRDVGGRGSKNVRRILEQFDWRKFQPLVVTKISADRYAIIDGQHRATAALMHPDISMVPCMIITATPVEAAECFSAINGYVTALTPMALFQARIAAGDASAVETQRVCAAGGVELLRYPVQRSKQKPSQTMAATTIERCIKQYGDEVVITALKTITECCEEPGVLTGTLIRSLCSVLGRNPVWCDAGGALLDAVSEHLDLGALDDDASHLARVHELPRRSVVEHEIALVLERELGHGRVPVALPKPAEMSA